MTTYTIRPATLADAETIARVHVDSWRTTYPGIVPQDYLDAVSYTERTSTWTAILKDEAPRAVEHGAVFVLEGQTGIAGFAAGGPIHGSWRSYDGDLYSVYLSAHTQGQGHGSRLVKTVAQHVSNLDLTSMLLWAFAANLSACRFYAKLGGRVAFERTVNLAGQDLLELAYGWPDIHTLLGGN